MGRFRPFATIRDFSTQATTRTRCRDSCRPPLSVPHGRPIIGSRLMSRKRKRNRLPASTPANPSSNAPLPPTTSDQPVQSAMLAPVSVVMLLASIALTIWIGKDLYAIVIEGEICRPRYRCQSWSSNPVSLGVQCLGFTLLITIFVGLAYCALKALMGRPSDDRA